jgi:hypothetical protein
MRKFLVKHFVLDYTSNIFGWQSNAPRASRIIYPLMVLSGWFSTTNPDWPNPTPLVWVLYSLLAASLFFGFVYFRFYPAKWEELDKFQKCQYGIFKQDELSLEQFSEWRKIMEEFDSKF